MKQATRALLLLGVVCGCGNPLDRVEKLSEVELPEEQAAQRIAADPEQDDVSFLASLFGRKVESRGDAVDIAPEASDASAAPDDAEIVPPDETPRRHAGFLGLFRRPTAETPEPPEEEQLAALPGEEVTSDAAPDLQVDLRGDQRRVNSAANDVAPGTILPFGTVGRVCAIGQKPPGTRIDKAGAGRGYQLIDSAPGSTEPRAFFVTGFADGCARQFTAALAMFGAPSMHEQLRYGKPAAQYPYSLTDKAYEKVKKQVCGVARKKPCGGKISKLERSTVFISAYERFSNNGRWADILLHDGAVLAAAVKTAQ